jgi:hypothetical protein
MVEISSSGSGGGPGWVTAPGYPTTEDFGFPDPYRLLSSSRICSLAEPASGPLGRIWM